MGRLKRYTEEEDELIFNSWHDPEKRKELPALLGRTMDGIGFRFYAKILNARGIANAKEYYNIMGVEAPKIGRKSITKVTEIQPPIQYNMTPIQNEVDGRLNKLEREVRSLRADFDLYIEEFMSGIISISDAVSNKDNAGRQYRKIKAETEQLRRKIEEARQEYLDKIAVYEKTYQELDQLVGQFINLSSIDKVASLGDFMPKLKLTFDKFGNMVKSERT